MIEAGILVTPVLLDAIAGAIARDERSTNVLSDLERQLVAALRPALEAFIEHVVACSPQRLDRRPAAADDDIDRCFAHWLEGDATPIHALLRRCTPEHTIRRCHIAATDTRATRAVRARLRDGEDLFAALLTEALGTGSARALERLELARWVAATESQLSLSHVPASPAEPPSRPAGASAAAIAASRLVALRWPAAPLSVWDPLAVAERAVLGAHDEAGSPLVRTDDTRAPWHVAVRRALTLTEARAQAWVGAHRERERLERAAVRAHLLASRALTPEEQSRAIASAVCDALDGKPLADDDNAALLTLEAPVGSALHAVDRALLALLLGQRTALRSATATADPLAFAIAVERTNTAADALDALEALARSNLEASEPRRVRASLRCARLLATSHAIARAPVAPIAERLTRWLPTAQDFVFEGIFSSEDFAAILRDSTSLLAVLPDDLAARATIAAAIASVAEPSKPAQE